MTRMADQQLVHVCRTENPQRTGTNGNGAEPEAGSVPGSAYYLILEAPPRGPRPHREPRCFGPFDDRTLAELLRTSAAYFGITLAN